MKLDGNGKEMPRVPKKPYSELEAMFERDMEEEFGGTESGLEILYRNLNPKPQKRDSK